MNHIDLEKALGSLGEQDSDLLNSRFEKLFGQVVSDEELIGADQNLNRRLNIINSEVRSCSSENLASVEVVLRLLVSESKQVRVVKFHLR